MRNKKTEEEDIVFEETEESYKDSAKKIKKTKDELNKIKSERQEYLDGWQRAKADLINTKKRLENEKKEFAKYATESIIIDLIPTLDSFDMAMNDKEAWEKAPENWRIGIEYIYNNLINTLTTHGVKILNPEGEKFDPEEHNSVKTEEGEEGIILKVLQKGYSINNKIIRPANVIVGEEK